MMEKQVARRTFLKQSSWALAACMIPSPFRLMSNTSINTSASFEVIIIGGSYAGLSAAMALGRSLRNVLVIDSGQPCNRQTPHSHNFLTQDGKTPREISLLARQQVEAYNTVRFLDDLAVEGRKTGTGFEIRTRSGGRYTAARLLFATGIKDVMPDIQGFSACWGVSVIHCPYCHGYEHRQKKTAILANGERAAHLASLVRNLTEELTILTPGKAEFTPAQLETFHKHGITLTASELTGLRHENGAVQQLLFKDREPLNVSVVYAALPFEQHSDIPVSLGCELTESGHIKVDPFYKTTVPGIFACGDNSGMMRSVANAVAGGNIAGALLNKELTDETW